MMNDYEDVADDNLTDDMIEDPEEDTLEDTEVETEGYDDELEEEADQEPDEDGQPEEVDPTEQRVRLSDGTEVSVKELMDGHLRQEDYTRKTQQVAQERKSVEEARSVVEQRLQMTTQTLSNLQNYIKMILPEQPRLSDFGGDHNQYNEAMSLYQAAFSELHDVQAMAGQLQSAQQQFSQEDLARAIADRDASLATQRPELADPARKAAFIDGIKGAVEAVGLDPTLVDQTSDPAILFLGELAAEGLKARQNRKKALSTKRVAKGKSKARPSGGLGMSAADRAALLESGDIAAIARNFDF